MFESLFSTTTTTDATITVTSAFLTIGVALALGLLISAIYLRTAKKGQNTQNFALTMIILPGIIAIIILLIGSNVARAFSLAGAFSIIRFRSAPGEPKDIAYVLFTLAAGLACGVGLFGYAVFFTIVLCVVMVVLDLFHFAESKSKMQLLSITVPEDLEYDGVFDDLFAKYTMSYDLKKVKTAALGSLYQLQYVIVMEETAGNTKAFLDEIRCRNGNLNISLTLYAEASDAY